MLPIITSMCKQIQYLPSIVTFPSYPIGWLKDDGVKHEAVFVTDVCSPGSELIDWARVVPKIRLRKKVRMEDFCDQSPERNYLKRSGRIDRDLAIGWYDLRLDRKEDRN